MAKNSWLFFFLQASLSRVLWKLTIRYGLSLSIFFKIDGGDTRQPPSAGGVPSLLDSDFIPARCLETTIPYYSTVKTEV